MLHWAFRRAGTPLPKFGAMQANRAICIRTTDSVKTRERNVAMWRLLRRTAPAQVRRWWLDVRRQRLYGPGDNPCRTVFEDTYRNGRWGGDADNPNSGPGSDGPAAERFAGVVQKLISTNDIRSVVDVGCGDFRVGAQLVSDALDYTGVDVVKSLVDRNTRLFGARNVRFVCADAVEDPLPDADLCIVRQVLQHLSNAKIASVLTNLRRYRFIIIAEVQPDPRRLGEANADKPTGPDTRLAFDSGVYLERPPFALDGVTVIDRAPLRRPYISSEEELVTYLIQRS